MQNRTKIIATLGPASNQKSMIGNMVEAGVRVFRLNFSHGRHDEKSQLIDNIRAIEQEKNIYLSILGDLQGPKLRTGTMTPVTLEKGKKYWLELGETSSHIPIPHTEIFQALETGDEITFSDGLIKLRIDEAGATTMHATCLSDGVLSSHKGINIPDKYIEMNALTDRDKKDLDFALRAEVDWIGLSFVQTLDDVQELRKLINGRAKLLSKIEKPKAVENIDAIIQHSDAIMIARGDLGIEVPLHDVPPIQKDIIHKCRQHYVPVIVATEMLESMIKNARPTRAEVNDIANAIYDGADCVMLSAETATGAYPLESATMMRDIIIATEQSSLYKEVIKKTHIPKLPPESNDVIAHAAIDVAEHLMCQAMVTFTQTGSTTLRAASTRSPVTLLSMTPELKTARAMALVWGIHSIKTRDDIHSFEDMVGKATRLSRHHGFSKNGDKITVTAGVPFGTAGKTNIIRVCTVGHHEKEE